MSKKRKTTMKKPPRPRYAKGDLVMVDWVDAFGCSTSWADLDKDNEAPMLCRSVGWLFPAAKDCTKIVPHVADVPDGPPQGCGDMTIPNACIRKVTVLWEAGAKN